MNRRKRPMISRWALGDLSSKICISAIVINSNSSMVRDRACTVMMSIKTWVGNSIGELSPLVEASNTKTWVKVGKMTKKLDSSFGRTLKIKGKEVARRRTLPGKFGMSLTISLISMIKAITTRIFEMRLREQTIKLTIPFHS